MQNQLHTPTEVVRLEAAIYGSIEDARTPTTLLQ